MIGVGKISGIYLKNITTVFKEGWSSYRRMRPHPGARGKRWQTVKEYISRRKSPRAEKFIRICMKRSTIPKWRLF